MFDEHPAPRLELTSDKALDPPAEAAAGQRYTRHLATLDQGKAERLSERDRTGVAWMAKTDDTSETASRAWLSVHAHTPQRHREQAQPHSRLQATRMKPRAPEPGRCHG